MKNFTNMKILIVEDEIDLSEILSEILSGLGATIYQTTKGKEALEIIYREGIDVALLDIQLPDISGIEILKRLYHQSCNTLCIIHTGHTELRYELEALRYNAYGFLEKPISCDIIIDEVRNALILSENNKLSNMGIKEFLTQNNSQIDVSKYEYMNTEDKNEILKETLSLLISSNFKKTACC